MSRRRRARRWAVIPILLFLGGCGDGPVVYLDVPVRGMDAGSVQGDASGDDDDDDDDDDDESEEESEVDRDDSQSGEQQGDSSDDRCDSDADCESDDRCEPTRGECVECLADADCPEDDAPRCLIGQNACVACFEHSDCEGESSLCDSGSMRCVECLADADCAASDGDGDLCDTDEGECIECRSDVDCTDLEDPVCDLEEGECAATTLPELRSVMMVSRLASLVPATSASLKSRLTAAPPFRLIVMPSIPSSKSEITSAISITFCRSPTSNWKSSASAPPVSRSCPPPPLSWPCFCRS